MAMSCSAAISAAPMEAFLLGCDSACLRAFWFEVGGFCLPFCWQWGRKSGLPGRRRRHHKTRVLLRCRAALGWDGWGRGVREESAERGRGSINFHTFFRPVHWTRFIHICIGSLTCGLYEQWRGGVGSCMSKGLEECGVLGTLTDHNVRGRRG